MDALGPSLAIKHTHLCSCHQYESREVPTCSKISEQRASLFLVIAVLKGLDEMPACKACRPSREVTLMRRAREKPQETRSHWGGPCPC